MSQTIRIVVADDHSVVRRALVQYLGTRADMKVIGEAPDGAAVLRIVESQQPDVVLMDYNMPQLNGVEATRQIHARYPQICVIGISMHEPGPVEREMLDAGASAYISKGEVALRLEQTIRQFASPEPIDPPES